MLDVGCGPGRLLGQLIDHGARATGIEVSETKVAEARQALADTSATVRLGRGEALGLPDASQDVVVYLRSLHHVPVAAMDGALREARRVLRDGGVLYVVEPLPEGDFYELVALVEDETEVRAAAQAALAQAGDAGFAHTTTERYETVGLYRDLDAVRAQIVGVDPARGPAFDARRAELERRFATGGELRGSLRWFAQPQQAAVLRAS